MGFGFYGTAVFAAASLPPSSPVSAARSQPTSPAVSVAPSTVTPPPPSAVQPTVYALSFPAGNVWEGGSEGLLFTAAAPPTLAKIVLVDGRLLVSGQLSGGTNGAAMVLTAAFLTTLTDGTHTLKIVYADSATSTGTFSVFHPVVSTPSTPPSQPVSVPSTSPSQPSASSLAAVPTPTPEPPQPPAPPAAPAPPAVVSVRPPVIAKPKPSVSVPVPSSVALSASVTSGFSSAVSSVESAVSHSAESLSGSEVQSKPNDRLGDYPALVVWVAVVSTLVAISIVIARVLQIKGKAKRRI